MFKTLRYATQTRRSNGVVLSKPKQNGDNILMISYHNVNGKTRKVSTSEYYYTGWLRV